MDVRIENLTKSYGNQKAVDSISFNIKSGEIIGFLGPNGAGKTTTMKILTQYMQPDSGTVWYGNKSSYNVDIRRQIGYLPEHNPLYDEMPLMDYLAFSAALQGVEKSQLEGRVREMIRLCGLDIEKHKKIGELSKGYKQRVGLAQAIIHNPQILVLDEPTTGLDPNQIVEIRELIKNLGREKTVILSTHILPEVEATCDRILIINKGKIAADGTVSELRKQSEGKHSLQVQIEGADPSIIGDQLKNINGIEKVQLIDGIHNRFEILSVHGELPNRDIYNCCVANQWILLEMIPSETKLEDIFRDLTVN